MTTGETRGLFTLYGDFRVFVLYSLGRMLFHMSLLLLKGEKEEADGLRIKGQIGSPERYWGRFLMKLPGNPFQTLTS